MKADLAKALGAARRTRDNYKDTSRFMAPEADPDEAWEKANDRICIMAKFILANYDDAKPSPKRS